MDDYLTKPATVGAVEAVLNRWVPGTDPAPKATNDAPASPGTIRRAG